MRLIIFIFSIFIVNLLSFADAENIENEELNKPDSETSGINQSENILQALEEDMVSIPGGTYQMMDFVGAEMASGEEPNKKKSWLKRTEGGFEFSLGDLLMETLNRNKEDPSDDQIIVQGDIFTVQPFKLGKHEVTFAQWDLCVADGDCSSYRPEDNGWGRDNRPVKSISWDDAQAFINWLNRKTGGSYRLPSEAEWDYAARAGSVTRYIWGDKVGRNQAVCKKCGSQWDNKQSAPVGSFPANNFGLYDMHGNVWEWTEDCGGTMLNTDIMGAIHRDGSARIRNGKLRSTCIARWVLEYKDWIFPQG